MIQTFANGLLFAALFFLPWQTAMIFTTAHVQGEPSAYGVFALYVVEVLIVFAYLLRRSWQTSSSLTLIVRASYVVLAAMFFSLSVSTVGWIGWFHLIHVVVAAMLFRLMIDERTDLPKAFAVFLLGLIVPVLFGWYQIGSGFSPSLTLFGMAQKNAATLGVAVVESGSERLLRAYGTFPHPNIFGGYIALGIVVLVWLTRSMLNACRLTAVMAAAAVLGATLVVTFSRSAWLGLFLAGCVGIGFLWHQRRMPPRRIVSVLIVGLVSLLTTATLFHTQVFSRFDTSQRLEIISLEERADQYQTFTRVFFESPFLGVGPAAYTFILERRDPGHPVWSYQPIHNTYLLILAELGVVGFSLLFYWAYRVGVIGYRQAGNTSRFYVLGISTLIMVIGFFDHYLWSLWPGLALSALCLASLVRWTHSSSDDVIGAKFR